MTDSADIARAAAYMNARIGLPWANGGKGPAIYDCGGLLAATQADLFGREIAIGNVDALDLGAVVRLAAEHPLKKIWVQAVRPVHGDVVLLSGSQRAHHFGTYMANDRGGLFHAIEDGGVRFDAMNTLAALGWSNLTFWRP